MIGPSKLELIELCAHYNPKPFDNQEAKDEGIMLHEAIETDDISNLDSEEQCELVGRCQLFRDGLLSKYRNPTNIREMKVEIFDDGKKLTRGIIDDIIIDAPEPTEAQMTDWKFGRMAVTEAGNNIQMLTYALALFQKYPTLQRIFVNVVCPRQDDTTTAMVPRSAMADILLRVHVIHARQGNEEVKATPHEKCCKGCASKATCSELCHLVTNVTDGLQAPAVLDPALLATPSERAKAQVLSAIVEDWAKQVRKANALAVQEDGEEIPGFDLRVRAGNLKIEDPAQAIHILINDVGMSLESVAACCNVSVAKLTEQMSVQLGGTKKSHRDELAETLPGLVAQSDSVVFLQRKRGKTDGEILQEAEEQRRKRVNA